MTTIARAACVAAVVGGFLSVAGLGAAQLPADPGQTHVHEGMDHAARQQMPPATEAPDYLTVNVEVSDGAIRPASVFIPAGRPVQLLVRNRGTMEHHYRVVGLTPISDPVAPNSTPSAV